MEALLLALAIEDEIEEARRQSATPVCRAESVDDIRDAVAGLQQSLQRLSEDVRGVGEVAVEACRTAVAVSSRKKDPLPKPPDYVMDVVRAKDGKITSINVRAV